MVSRRLMATWVFLDFCLLLAGGLSLALSIVWRTPDMLLNMVFSDAYLTAGMLLGVALLITFLVSLVAIAQKNRVTLGLVILNWLLIFDAIGVGVTASLLWWDTLQERANFHHMYELESPGNKIFVQDKFSCCGYFNASDLVEFGGTFCKDAAFVQSPAFLPPNGTNPEAKFCVTPLTAYADVRLNSAFTTIYGFMAIIVGLFLASLCVISRRLEAERFRKIDLKRGGGGFV